MKEFIFGTFAYEYELIKQNRKTLSLTVTPDLRVVLKCPEKTEDQRIQMFLQRKWFWLEKQLSFFKKYQRKIYEKEYSSGEGYLYLGKQYKLLIQKRKNNNVSLTKDKLIISTAKEVNNKKYTKKLLDEWFEEKTRNIFQERYVEISKLFDYKSLPELCIRDMKKRWGSFLNKNKIFLNPKLIHASKDCIDYVIIHELCHMRYKNHDKKFFSFLKEKCPRWEKIKEKLELFII